MINVNREDLNRLVEQFMIAVHGAVDKDGLRVRLPCEPPVVERALLAAMSTVTDSYIKPADVVIFGQGFSPRMLSSREMMEQFAARGIDAETTLPMTGRHGENKLRSGALRPEPLTQGELSAIEAAASATIDRTFEAKMAGHPRAYMEFFFRNGKAFKSPDGEYSHTSTDQVKTAAYRVLAYEDPETAVEQLNADLQAMRQEAAARGPGDPVLIFRRKMELRQEQDFSTDKWRFNLNLRVAAVPGSWVNWDASKAA